MITSMLANYADGKDNQLMIAMVQVLQKRINTLCFLLKKAAMMPGIHENPLLRVVQQGLILVEIKLKHKQGLSRKRNTKECS